jgi:hypothetical protein
MNLPLSNLLPEFLETGHVDCAPFSLLSSLADVAAWVLRQCSYHRRGNIRDSE